MRRLDGLLVAVICGLAAWAMLGAIGYAIYLLTT